MKSPEEIREHIKFLKNKRRKIQRLLKKIEKDKDSIGVSSAKTALCWKKAESIFVSKDYGRYAVKKRRKILDDPGYDKTLSNLKCFLSNAVDAYKIMIKSIRWVLK